MIFPWFRGGIFIRLNLLIMEWSVRVLICYIFAEIPRYSLNSEMIHPNHVTW
jgi:hypothetical protein